MPEQPELLLLDASALVELVIDGRHRRGADALLARYAAAPRQRPLLATAAHGLIEAVSALRRLVQRGALDATAGAQAVGWLGALDVALDPTGPRMRRVWTLREQMSAYDAAYAAAAEALDAPLVTVDARLQRACGDAGIPAHHLDALA